jgi:hypothetical protein
MAGRMLLKGRRSGLRGQIAFVPVCVAIDGAYRPRNPEESLLYKVVAGYFGNVPRPIARAGKACACVRRT